MQENLEKIFCKFAVFIHKVLTLPWRFLRCNKLEQLKLKSEKIIGI